MVRKLKEKDRQSLLEFLEEESTINLFIIGDVENYGFDEEFMEVWGGFSKEEIIRSVLLRYYNAFIVYYKEKTNDINEFKSIIKKFNGDKKVVSCRSNIAKDFEDLFLNFERVDSNFCEINSNKDLYLYDDEVKIANVEDTERIYNLTNGIEEFITVTEETKKQIKMTLESGTGRIYYIEDENRNIISKAETSAECSKAAMVVGVATAKEYRKKGLVSKCISKICKDILAEGKKLCLFYENPVAGKIYKKIGFKDIDKWTMIVES